MIVAQVSDKATIPPSDSNREEEVPPHTPPVLPFSRQTHWLLHRYWNITKNNNC